MRNFQKREGERISLSRIGMDILIRKEEEPGISVKGIVYQNRKFDNKVYILTDILLRMFLCILRLENGKYAVNTE